MSFSIHIIIITECFKAFYKVRIYHFSKVVNMLLLFFPNTYFSADFQYGITVLVFVSRVGTPSSRPSGHEPARS